MQKVLNYLRTRHQTLRNDYMMSNGEDEKCSSIACEIAELIIQEGWRPYIMEISEQFHNESWQLEHKHFMPQIYDDRVEWIRHYICCCHNTVYDPLLGVPIELNQYNQVAFWEQIKMQLLTRPQSISWFDKRLTMLQGWIIVKK